MIPVTKTYLPDLKDYTAQLERIWESKWITNRGSLALELESKLKSLLSVEHLLLMTNGTLPLQIAIKNIAKGKEVITTPFSYVATTSAIVWEGCTPVFVDIEADHWTIDATKIENTITEETGAILATHVFGNPCDVTRIEEIGRKHDVPVIYDAAHAFGVKYNGQSLFQYGDINTCSFHATKLFHTGEGGAIVARDSSVFDKLYYSHNFGHDGYEKYHGLGINAKISELQAAMGLAMLPHMEEIKEARKTVVDLYDALLDDRVEKLAIRKGTEWNYSYYPILLVNESTLLKVEQALLDADVRPRRYFYPSLNKLAYVADVSMPISEHIASRVLCLPLYVGLDEGTVNRVVDIIQLYA